MAERPADELIQQIKNRICWTVELLELHRDVVDTLRAQERRLERHRVALRTTLREATTLSSDEIEQIMRRSN